MQSKQYDNMLTTKGNNEYALYVDYVHAEVVNYIS